MHVPTCYLARYCCLGQPSSAGWHNGINRTRADKIVSADDCSIVSVYLSLFFFFFFFLKVKMAITDLARRLMQKMIHG